MHFGSNEIVYGSALGTSFGLATKAYLDHAVTESIVQISAGAILGLSIGVGAVGLIIGAKLADPLFSKLYNWEKSKDAAPAMP